MVDGRRDERDGGGFGELGGRFEGRGPDRAERRHEPDPGQRFDKDSDWRQSDELYLSWRYERMAQLDRDFEAFRQERQQRLAADFDAWREARKMLLALIDPGMFVVDMDGTRVGIVDRVEGGHLKILADDVTRHPHLEYVPPLWIEAVDDDRVRLNRTIDDVKRQWRTIDRRWRAHR